MAGAEPRRHTFEVNDKTPLGAAVRQRDADMDGDVRSLLRQLES